MSKKIEVGDISDSEAIAIGEGAEATVTHTHHYAPPDFPLDNLPPANRNFTGRAALLDAIQSSFDNQQSSIAITQAIAGLGGVGKTQLALAYAHAHRADYDLIWQLQADDPAALDGDLRQLGLVLHLPVQTADAPTARKLVLSWLNGSDQRWLLLYDNADQMDAHALRPYLPGGQGHVLITSRRTNWPDAKRLRLDVFTPDEASDFWRQRLVQSFDHAQDKPGRLDQSYAELAEELGCLPLALEQAAAYMVERTKSAADYLALYRVRRQELWKRETPPDKYHATVATTWEMAFAHARQTPGAAALLNLCCFLAPNEISLAMITAHADTLPEALAAVVADELALDDALAALQTYSLLKRDGDMLAVHRLVQTVARDRMGAERAKKWAEAAIKLMMATLPDTWTHLHEWDDGPKLLPHMMMANDLASKVSPIKSVADLCTWTGYYLQFRGDYVSARPYYERALAIYEKALGPDHPDTARSLNNLGFLHRALGDLPAARPYYERAWPFMKKPSAPTIPTPPSASTTWQFWLITKGTKWRRPG